MKELAGRIMCVLLFMTLWTLFQATPGLGAENPPLKIMVNENVILQSSNGSTIQCYFFMPVEKPRPLPVVIVVPPGSQEAQTIFPFARAITESGVAVLCFDPLGRGKSAGSEDYNGPANQDDLAIIVKYLRSLRGEVDHRNIGILSFYDGTTMATGMLFKYPKLDVKYLIDLEGPATREDAIKMRVPVPPGAGIDDFFWKEREGLTFIKRIFCRYLRLQCKVDHSMNEDKSYAIKMHNAALKGKSPWARCNYNGTYQEMDPAFPGKYQWLRSVDKDVICRFVNEMAQMEPLPESFKN